MKGRTKPLIPGRTEAEVMGQVLEAARMCGVDLRRQNTGAGLNPAGRMVRFGTPGDPDLHGVLPDGRALMVECKREGFDPAKLRGAGRAHFDRQLRRLREVNVLGGCAWWTDDAAEFLAVLQHVLAGASVVEWDDGQLVVIYPPAPKEVR